MDKQINLAIEYNDEGTMIYLTDYTGAFTRGTTKEMALEKIEKEYYDYLHWAYNIDCPHNNQLKVTIIQEKFSELQISDADTDIIFDKEKEPITMDEYKEIKKLVLKSANDFQKLYESIPDKQYAKNNPRSTFYGEVPNSAMEMYNHTNGVTNYYLNGLNLGIDDVHDIYTNRIAAMKLIEENPVLLYNEPLFIKNEFWTLSKVLRRFLWHDRIHAKAMFKLASLKWQDTINCNFHFKL